MFLTTAAGLGATQPALVDRNTPEDRIRHRYQLIHRVVRVILINQVRLLRA